VKTSPKTLAKPVKKTVPQPGQYVYRPLKCAVISCSCGDKYIKTRKNQTHCLRCIIEGRDVVVSKSRAALKTSRR
jgi:hypothetical protein